MYIKELETQDLTNDQPGRAVVLFSAKEVIALNNLLCRASKGKELTETERNLRKDFSVLSSIIGHGCLLDCEFDMLCDIYKN